jgi:hypothetical protein
MVHDADTWQEGAPVVIDNDTHFQPGHARLAGHLWSCGGETTVGALVRKAES